MVYEENREFSANSHGIVGPLAEHYVAVTLDYWQIFWGPGSTRPGRFLQKYNFKGIDTAGQVVLSPDGKLISAHRSWKTGKGYGPEELLEYATRYSSGAGRKNRLKLSWFMVDPEYYAIDLGTTNASRYCSATGAMTAARKVRRPLVRVDGMALDLLEEHQEFLERHVRQFWWQKGDKQAAARLIVLDVHNTSGLAKPSELTGACPAGKVPEVLAAIDLSSGVDLDEISRVLDRAWRQYMMKRPSNADNLTFAKENIDAFKQVDAQIRALAREGKLLAPGGRALLDH